MHLVVRGQLSGVISLYHMRPWDLGVELSREAKTKKRNKTERQISSFGLHHSSRVFVVHC